MAVSFIGIMDIVSSMQQLGYAAFHQALMALVVSIAW